MTKYEVWFEDRHVMMVLEGLNASEVRKEFNKLIKFKKGDGKR